MGQLNFLKPDRIKFPVLDLAYRAAEAGGTAPCVLNASNEVAVAAFLEKKIKFLEIPRLIEAALEKHWPRPRFTLEEILDLDRTIRRETEEIITVKV